MHCWEGQVDLLNERTPAYGDRVLSSLPRCRAAPGEFDYDDYAMILFLSEVEVLRPEKF